jgi:hypothetical protein
MINMPMKHSPKASKKHTPKRSRYKCFNKRGEVTCRFDDKTKKAYVPVYRPVLSWKLNNDVTNHIFTFVDDESICTAMQVCKRFRDNLGSLRINVSMAGYKSFQAFRQWHYPRATFYSARNSPFITDEWLSFIAAHNRTRYAFLNSIDIRGCNGITIGGIAQFVEAMDYRLRRLAISHFHESEIEDTDAVRKLEALLGKTPCLESLTLELNKAWVDIFSFNCLDRNTSLRELSIMLDWPTFLPAYIPYLETLRLEIVDDYIDLYWAQLHHAAYPKLKRLEITVCSHFIPHLALDIDYLIEAIEENQYLKGLEVLVIRRQDRHHAMDKGFDQRVTITTETIQNERYRSISVEREEWRQLKAFCRARNIDCTFPLIPRHLN